MKKMRYRVEKIAFGWQVVDSDSFEAVCLCLRASTAYYIQEALERKSGRKQIIMMKKNEFQKMLSKKVTCDICGEVMLPMYGGGWDNDRLVCAARDCQAEITFPTSTEVKK